MLHIPFYHYLHLSIAINTIVPNAPFLYHLKTLENRKVLGCFLGVEKGCIENKWVKVLSSMHHKQRCI